MTWLELGNLLVSIKIPGPITASQYIGRFVISTTVIVVYNFTNGMVVDAYHAFCIVFVLL